MVLLGLGIGMSTALFSVLYSVVLKPLPVKQQDRLVVIWKGNRRGGGHVGELSYPEFQDWQRQSKGFEAMAAMPTTVYGYGLTLTGYGDPVELERAPVSAAFFSLLGARPALGRTFLESDNHPGAEPVVVLAHSVWRQLFGADRSVIGKVVSLDGQGYTVIGVMPADFDFPAGAQLWTPLGLNAAWMRRNATFLQAVGKLKSGVSLEQANTDVAGTMAQVARQYPQDSEPGEFPVLTPLVDYFFGISKPAILLLWAASLLLLAIACLNVTGVLLARALSREKEVAIRLALGANRASFLRQFIAEGLVLSSAGAVAGCAVARILIALVIALGPAGLPAAAGIPRLASVHLNAVSLVFASLLSVIMAVAFGLAPALVSLKRNVRDFLEAGGARTAGSRRSAFLRTCLVAAESAVATLLLISAGMAVHNFHRLEQVRLGFVPENVLTAQIPLPGADPSRRNAFFTELLGKLQSRPEVIAAGAILLRPFEGTIGWDAPYQVQGQDADEARTNPVSNLEVVTPGYFQAAGTPLLAGRYFNLDDRDPNPKVAIVSESLARNEFGSVQRSVGRQIRLGQPDDRNGRGGWCAIVGVVADGQYRTFGVTQGDIFLPYLQTNIPVRYLVVRTKTDPASFVPVLRREVTAMDGEVAVSKVRTMPGLIAGARAGPRFVMLLFSLFAIFAAWLASVGVYGVVADSVAQRRREIGIRIALGAQRGNVLMLLSQGELRAVLVGEFVGLVLAMGVARAYAHFLYGLQGTDFLSIASAMVVLSSVSLAAGVVPGFRVTRVPVTHLLIE